ncbi:hypothetical protein BLOT_003012 [Blomia tropicalis]|nr:hypothetical protein BLOT_003012 [Blomia tropicalis]
MIHAYIIMWVPNGIAMKRIGMNMKTLQHFFGGTRTSQTEKKNGTRCMILVATLGRYRRH